MAASTALGLSIIGVLGGTASSYGQSVAAQSQARMQSEMAMMQGMMENESAKFQQNVANMNAEAAIDEGKEAKRVAAENATRTRAKAAEIIGQQRAAMGATGAQVDQGANLDLQLDTIEKGELDALAVNETGLWQDYNKRLEAANYRAQGVGAAGAGAMALAKGGAQSSLFNAQANSYTPWLSAGSSLVSGLGQAGFTYMGLKPYKGVPGVANNPLSSSGTNAISTRAMENYKGWWK